MVMAWASFSIPIAYTKGDMPDSVIIGLVSSNNGSTAVAGSYLWVDSLNFFGTVPNGVIDATNNRYSIMLSPNPAKDNLSIDFGTAVSDNVKLQVIDMYGRVVTTSEFTSGKQVYSLNLNTVAPGTYFVKLQVGEEMQTQRLVVQ
jgi:hypothetical protein